MRRALCLMVLVWHAAWAQGDPARPEFEVALIKPASGEGSKASKVAVSGDRVDLPNTTVKAMVAFAYDVTDRLVLGLPEWAISTRYDLIAKTAPQTSHQAMLGMLQSLLADRFQLTMHREERPLQVYALVTGKSPKLQPASGVEMTCTWHTLDNGRQRECHNMTMEQLAAHLPNWFGSQLDYPVIDMTGLRGVYDFTFEIMASPKRVKSDLSSDTIFDAVARLGLKLEQRKHPVSVLVIDHLERPTAN